MSELHIGVGSKNEVKLSAAKRAFTGMFPKDLITIHAYDTESGVVAQPLSTEISFKGAKNRANSVINIAGIEQTALNFAVGLEGGIDCINGKDMYVLEGCAWVVSLGNLAIGFGRSSGLPLPAALSHRLAIRGEELGPIASYAFEDETLRTGIGINGILTNKDYTREIEFFEATSRALAPFVNEYAYDAVRYVTKR